ncbi:MAG: hypothetical protein ACP5LE_08240 [Thermoplasmata archaeon]
MNQNKMLCSEKENPTNFRYERDTILGVAVLCWAIGMLIVVFIGEPNRYTLFAPVLPALVLVLFLLSLHAGVSSHTWFSVYPDKIILHYPCLITFTYKMKAIPKEKIEKIVFNAKKMCIEIYFKNGRRKILRRKHGDIFDMVEGVPKTEYRYYPLLKVLEQIGVKYEIIYRNRGSKRMIDRHLMAVVFGLIVAPICAAIGCFFITQDWVLSYIVLGFVVFLDLAIYFMLAYMLDR